MKASKQDYTKIEMDCELCECKVSRWKAHTEMQKRKNIERVKRREEEKLSEMSEEEKDEYIMIRNLQNILNKVRL